MKILPVSEKYTNQNRSIKFTSKKDKQPDGKTINSTIKTAVPTAALILAMLSDPLAVNEVNGEDFNNENTELQWHRPAPLHRAPRRPAPHRKPPRYPSGHHAAPPAVYGYPANPYYGFYPYPYAEMYRLSYPYPAYDFILAPLYMQQYINSINALKRAYNCPISIGGVTFNQSEVSAVTNASNNNGYTTVKLKNGTTVTYPYQSDDKYAMVYPSDGTMIFEGLSNATITGTAGYDRYTLKGCQNTNVIVNGDFCTDRIKITKFRVLPDKTRQYTDNVKVEANNGDIVNGEKIYTDKDLFYSGY